MKNRNKLVFISAIALIAVFALFRVIIYLRLNSGVEFEGGRSYEINFSDSIQSKTPSVFPKDSSHRIGPTFKMKIETF